MDDKSILCILDSDVGVSLTFYEDGTYVWSGWGNNRYSLWKMSDEGELSVNHDPIKLRDKWQAINQQPYEIEMAEKVFAEWSFKKNFIKKIEE